MDFSLGWVLSYHLMIGRYSAPHVSSGDEGGAVALVVFPLTLPRNRDEGSKVSIGIEMMALPTPCTIQTSRHYDMIYFIRGAL
jgi:hypothetical protein